MERPGTRLPYPSGVATSSPWLDVTYSTPSYELNAPHHYLPARTNNPSGYEFPSDSIWPASPPRKDLYAEDALLAHPLVSPIATKDWAGSCLVFIGTGQDLSTDEDSYVSALAAKQGVKWYLRNMKLCRIFSRWCWGIYLLRDVFFDGWAGFIMDVVERPESVGTKGQGLRQSR